MNITYRKSLLAGMIAALMAAPGALAAQQLEAPQADSERQGQRTEEAPAPETAAPETNPASGAIIMRTDPLVSALTPQNLEQMKVIDASGEKIGKVEDVVRSRENGLIYVVVSSGGLLGIGTKAIPVPLESLRVQGDALRIATTADDLRNRSEYEEDRYAELDPANQPISEFSAFEVIPPEQDGSVSEPEPTRER
jgi:sporulation protein YlmC with PRC-barrel domain